jgi:hypothetical protein
MNEEVVFAQATEPSNIIWENRYIVGANYYARITGITCVSVFMLVLAFLVIFSFKKLQLEESAKWPDIKLSTYETMYKTEKPKLLKFAGLEYDSQLLKNPPPM